MTTLLIIISIILVLSGAGLFAFAIYAAGRGRMDGGLFAFATITGLAISVFGVQILVAITALQ